MEVDIASELVRLQGLEDQRRELISDLQQQIEALQDRIDQRTLSIDMEIASVIEKVESEVLKRGCSIKACSGPYRAQYNKGRTSWDSKKLDGLSLLVPQINECKSVGEPYVSIVRK